MQGGKQLKGNNCYVEKGKEGACQHLRSPHSVNTYKKTLVV